jgi:hypothetical protein
MIERESYTRFKVRRTGGAIKELTVTLLWFEEGNPDIFDFVEVFEEAEKMSKNVIEVNPYMRIDREGKKGKPKIVDPLDPLGLLDKERKPKAEEYENATPIDKIDREKLPTYTILKKTVNPIKWNKFFYKMAIGFTSIWLIYAFIKWVMVFFVIGGFKSKTTQ